MSRSLMGASSRPRVGVIGAGRVGPVLAARMRQAGHAVAITCRSDTSALRLATLLPGIAGSSPETIVANCDVLIIAVPDSRIGEIVADIAPMIRDGQIVVHTSGAHGVAVLAPLAERGARTMALHPAMTFTGTQIDLTRSCVFGTTCAEHDREIAETLVAELGGTPMWIAEADRAAYHAALAHGANHLSTVITQSMQLLREIGADDPAAVLRPLIEAAVDNTLAFGDAALTGPVVRGDADTVRAHLSALSDPDTRHSYQSLATATTERAERAERIDPFTAEELRWVISDGARR